MLLYRILFATNRFDVIFYIWLIFSRVRSFLLCIIFFHILRRSELKQIWIKPGVVKLQSLVKSGFLFSPWSSFWTNIKVLILKFASFQKMTKSSNAEIFIFQQISMKFWCKSVSSLICHRLKFQPIWFLRNYQFHAGRIWKITLYLVR